MEIFNPEKPKKKRYLPEVQAIIEIINNEGKGKNKDFLKQREKDLASMSEKKETLRHSQRMTNLGYLLARKKIFSDEEPSSLWKPAFCMILERQPFPGNISVNLPKNSARKISKS